MQQKRGIILCDVQRFNLGEFSLVESESEMLFES